MCMKGEGGATVERECEDGWKVVVAACWPANAPNPITANIGLTLLPAIPLPTTRNGDDGTAAPPGSPLR